MPPNTAPLRTSLSRQSSTCTRTPAKFLNQNPPPLAGLFYCGLKGFLVSPGPSSPGRKNSDRGDRRPGTPVAGRIPGAHMPVIRPGRAVIHILRRMQ